jgi:4-amino-4-deoxy-L-arabinose transferase-like glycosyltransferase
MLIYTTYIFMRRFMNERIALLTYVFLLFTPELVARGMSSYLEPLAAIFILLTLDFYLRDKPVKSGITFGLAQLSKYSSLFFIPALITHEFITSRNLKKIGMVILITAIISLPLFARNYILYNNPIEPWSINAAPSGAEEHFSFFENPVSFLGMTYSSYYFSSANVGGFVPDGMHFATGALLFDWGNVITIKTPGDRILRIHVFDLVSSGLLFLLMIYGGFSLYKHDRKKFLIVVNIIFWYALLFIPWSLRAFAPAARYVLTIFPFLALLTAFGFYSVHNRIKNVKLRYAFCIVIFLCLIYLYILQIDRAILFAQHYNEILNHPYILDNYKLPLY